MGTQRGAKSNPIQAIGRNSQFLRDLRTVMLMLVGSRQASDLVVHRVPISPVRGIEEMMRRGNGEEEIEIRKLRVRLRQ